MRNHKLFNEENTVENLVKDILVNDLGWNFVSRDKLSRKETEVLIEDILSERIQKLNPDTTIISDKIEEIIYKLINLTHKYGAVVQLG